MRSSDASPTIERSPLYVTACVYVLGPSALVSACPFHRVFDIFAYATRGCFKFARNTHTRSEARNVHTRKTRVRRQWGTSWRSAMVPAGFSAGRRHHHQRQQHEHRHRQHRYQQQYYSYRYTTSRGPRREDRRSGTSAGSRPTYQQRRGKTNGKKRRRDRKEHGGRSTP